MERKNEDCLVEEKRQTLKLVSGIDVFIEAQSGKRTIASSEEVFKSFLSPDFRRWKIDVPGQATPGINLKIFDLESDFALSDLFTPFGSFNQVELTQSQIVRFCEKYPHLVLPVEGSTFLPFACGKTQYATVVKRFDDGLFVVPRYLQDEDFLRGSVYHYRIIVPESAVLNSIS